MVVYFRVDVYSRADTLVCYGGHKNEEANFSLDDANPSTSTKKSL